MVFTNPVRNVSLKTSLKVKFPPHAHATKSFYSKIVYKCAVNKMTLCAIRWQISMLPHMHARIYTHTCTDGHTHTYACTYTYTNTHAQNTRINTYTHMYTNTHTHAHTGHTHKYTHTNTHREYLVMFTIFHK